MKVEPIGLDSAKNVFALFGVDENEQPVLRKIVRHDKLLETFVQLEPCVIGMEACSGAHHWARERCQLGHEPCLMAPQFVCPSRKNDHNDAEAISEAVGRPNKHFVEPLIISQIK